jgi:ubiquinone/menaquinone biosynthesis C-methylase UbiE
VLWALKVETLLMTPDSFTSTPFDGTLYSAIFDRLLDGLHQRITAWVDEGASGLEACCGSGGLTFHLARRCRRVVGVDLSSKMIARAKKLQIKRKIPNLHFQLGDVTKLDEADNSFDVACICLGLHEMPAESRSKVLPTLLRIAPKVVLVDFVSPMPKNSSGLRNRIIELLAGPSHFSGYIDYQRSGGLLPLIQSAGAKIIRHRKLDRDTLWQLELSR